MWTEANREDGTLSKKKKETKTEKEEEEESFFLCVLKEGEPLQHHKLSLEWWADAAP